MKNVNIAWELPTTRESGFPLDPADIQHVEVSMSADLGANFIVVNTVAPPTLDLTVPDLEVGDWIFRLVVVDTANRRSIDVDVTVNVPDETNPSSVVNVVVSFV
ncbi:MAG: hypothetical protein ACXADH_03995 [Candidatus Kariarchaeaceae archaeon]|jgi:hypothetical protein